jgi:hypothetical protein
VLTCLEGLATLTLKLVTMILRVMAIKNNNYCHRHHHHHHHHNLGHNHDNNYGWNELAKEVYFPIRTCTACSSPLCRIAPAAGQVSAAAARWHRLVVNVLSVAYIRTSQGSGCSLCRHTFDSIIPQFFTKDWGRPWKFSVSIVGVPAEIGTGHLPNTFTASGVTSFYASTFSGFPRYSQNWKFWGKICGGFSSKLRTKWILVQIDILNAPCRAFLAELIQLYPWFLLCCCELRAEFFFLQLSLILVGFNDG